MWLLARLTFSRAEPIILSMSKAMSENSDEARLGALAKRLLATPPKPRDESKVGKHTAKPKGSPRRSRKAAPKRG